MAGGATHEGRPGGPGQGGLDQSMPGGSAKNLQVLLDGGNMSMAAVNESVLRILTPMFSVGLFESVDVNGSLLNSSRWVGANVTSAEHNAVARQLAARAMVLLKNEGDVLPIGKQVKTIALIGAQAAHPVVHGGGSGQVFPAYVAAPLDSIRAKFAGPANCSTPGGPGNCVLYDDGKDPETLAPTVKAAEIAIVFLATDSGEGQDRKSLAFDGSGQGGGPQQDELVASVAAAAAAGPHHTKVVVVMVSPGAVLTPWRDSVDGMIACIMPGQEFGNALTDVLWGDVAPTARLPFTLPAHDNQMPFTQEQWPGVPAPVYDNNEPTSVMGANGLSTYSEKLLVGHRYYDAHGLTPAFCFGHGLGFESQAKFTYSSLKASRSEGARFTLSNSGSVDAATVVQLYLGFPAEAGEPPKVLKGFKHVQVKAGGSAQVTLPLPDEALSIWDVASSAWKVQAGTFTAMVGESSCDIRLNATFLAQQAERSELKNETPLD